MPALRLFSLLDGISYIVLLGIAMPLKYLADKPLAVRVTGSVHGALLSDSVCACSTCWCANGSRSGAACWCFSAH